MVGRERWCAGRAELKWFFCVFFAFFCLVIFGLPEFFFANENSPVCHQFSPRPKIPLVFFCHFFFAFWVNKLHIFMQQENFALTEVSPLQQNMYNPGGAPKGFYINLHFCLFLRFFVAFFEGHPQCVPEIAHQKRISVVSASTPFPTGRGPSHVGLFVPPTKCFTPCDVTQASHGNADTPLVWSVRGVE